MHKQGILSIAALDSSGGAGINQDIRVSALMGYQIHTCLTGITIQTKHGVEQIHPITDEVLFAQLRRILLANSIQYIKIGALCSWTQIDIITKLLHKTNDCKVVLDPVISPSLGIPFIPVDKIEAFKQLLHAAHVLAPNLIELSILSSMDTDDFESAIKAAKHLGQQYELAVLVKDGHGEGKVINEAMVTENKIYTYQRERKKWNYRHGTGCALSTAFICKIAQGMAFASAFEEASLWVSEWYDKLNNG